jgi:DNA-binding NarL/FixJ family response regulator
VSRTAGALFVCGIRHYLQQVAEIEPIIDVEIVAETGRGDEALELAHNLHPDVVILDLHLPGLHGVQVARVLRRDLPEIHIIVLTGYYTKEYARALTDLGVHCYLIKGRPPDALVQAIQAVRGSGHTSARRSTDGGAIAPGRPTLPVKALLSGREREVLTYLSHGARSKDIARDLGIGLYTVNGYIADIFDKLEAKSRAEAVTIGIQRGLITSLARD